jgi:hypothetical protein
MVDPQNTFGPLTADDIAALKLADKVVYSLSTHGSLIRAGIESQRDGNVFTAREQRLFPKAERSEREREINVLSAAHGYGKHGESRWHWNLEHNPFTTAPSCFDMAHNAKYDHNLQTLIHSLRAGETLRMIWTGDNNNDLVREAGLHVDQLDVIVIPAREGAARRSYCVETSVCADNTARMIRRNGF